MLQLLGGLVLGGLVRGGLVRGGVAAILTGLPFGAVSAQEAGIAGNEIIVTATLDDPAAGADAPHSALESGEVSAFAPVSITQNLSRLPGIVAFEKGGAGGGSYVSVRGGEPNFAIVVINGVRVDDPLNSSGGGFDFSQLDPAMVSRADVIWGPRSTAYGADALSGVISLGTSREEAGAAGGATGGVTGGARAGVGSGGRYEMGGHLGLTDGVGKLSAAFGLSDSNDFMAGSGHRRFSAMIAASPDLNPKSNGAMTLDLFGLFAESSGAGFPEDSGGPRLAASNALETRDRQQIVLGGTLAAQIDPKLIGQLRAGFLRSDYRAVSPAIAPGILDGVPPITIDNIFERFEAVASLSWEVGEHISIEGGASLNEESGTSVGQIDFGILIPTEFTISRSMPGLFGTVTADVVNGASVSAGLRADWPEGGAMRWTPRVGARIPIAGPQAAIFANYAKGFKRPSLFALGYPLIANPDLEDERSEAFDAGIELGSEQFGWSGSFTLFRSIYRNLIDFDPALFTNVNRNKVTAQGVELAITGTKGPFSLRGAMTYLSSKSDDGTDLRFRPKWTGRLSFGWQASRNLSISADGEFSSSFNDSSVPTGLIQSAGFQTLALQVEWAISGDVELYGTLRNITDNHYERAVGFQEPGRNVFVGVRTAF